MQYLLFLHIKFSYKVSLLLQFSLLSVLPISVEVPKVLNSVIEYPYFSSDVSLVTICNIFMFYFLQVNQKMILTLAASIMYWYLKRPTSHSLDSENGSSCETSSTTISDDSASESSFDDNAAG